MDLWGREKRNRERKKNKPVVNYERQFSVIWLLLSKIRDSPGDFSVICCHPVVPANIVLLCASLWARYATHTVSCNAISKMWRLRLSDLIKLAQSQLVVND